VRTWDDYSALADRLCMPLLLLLLLLSPYATRFSFLSAPVRVRGRRWMMVLCVWVLCLLCLSARVFGCASVTEKEAVYLLCVCVGGGRGGGLVRFPKKLARMRRRVQLQRDTSRLFDGFSTSLSARKRGHIGFRV
jgi:hypothetical protein